MFGISGTFAQYERKLIRKRTMSGKRQRAQEGQQPSRAMHPFGFHVVTKADVMSGIYSASLLGTYQVVEDKAVIVRRIFHSYASGASLDRICRDLQQEGIPTPREGNYWRRCTVQRILKNPVYKGTPAYGRHRALSDEARAATGRKVQYIVMTDEANWIYLSAPALVDEATFAFCQKRLALGRPLRAGNPKRVHMLAGLIQCPDCGKRMRGKWVKRTYKGKEPVFDHYYQCQDAFPSSNPGRHVCNGQNYRAASMEPLTVKAICAIVRQPELVQKALHVYTRQAEKGDREAERQSLRKKLSDLEMKERATIEAQIAGIMAGANAASYSGILAELAKERECIQVRLTELGQQEKQVEAEKVADVLARIFADVEQALTDEEIETAERRKLLSGVVSKILPRKDEEGEWGVLVTLRSPSVEVGKEGLDQIVSMISTFARGTVTLRPSWSLASRTRTHVSDSTCTNSGGSAVTFPRRPK
jgi:site-specific DNA recombinase